MSFGKSSGVSTRPPVHALVRRPLWERAWVGLNFVSSSHSRPGMSTTFSPAGKMQSRPESAPWAERTAETIPPMRSEFQDLCLQGAGLAFALRSAHESHNAAQPQASEVRRRSETPGVGQHGVLSANGRNHGGRARDVQADQETRLPSSRAVRPTWA